MTGVSEGTANITVTTGKSGFKDTCIVTVDKSALPAPLISLGFDENSGLSVTNTGLASATFTKTEIPTWSENIPSVGGTSSVDFGTSTGDYHVQSLNTVSELAGMTSFTVTGWVNCRDISVGSGGNRIVTWIYSGDDGVDIVHDASGSLKVGINQWPDNTTAVSSPGKITADPNAGASNWKFFAVTYESSSGTLNIYFGDNATSATLDKSCSYNKGAVGTNIGHLCIGQFNAESIYHGYSRMFKGLIDEVEIFNSALSLQQIKAVQKQESVISSLEVSDTTLSVADTANSTVTFDITSNTDWTVSSDESWLTANITSGSNDTTITLTASANTGLSPRTATVTVAGTDVTDQAITVTQAAGTETGIDETGNTDIVFYPNPVSSVLTISGLPQNSTVLINDINGKCVKSIRATSNQIDVSSLSKGMYFLKIKDQKGFIVRNFIKQ